MYEIIKHAAKQTTTLFTSPCESMARARFNKSAGLLKLNETLELRHEGKVIDSVSKKVQRDEDGEIIFPETSSKLEHTMKSLYCIAGSLPAQFRSSPVDCGIGWKEHAKKEPRKAKETIDQPLAWIGIDPAAEPKHSIDFSIIKPGDKVMLVDGETFKHDWARDFTKNKIYEVCEVDIENTDGLQIKLIDDVEDCMWVFTDDVRPIGFVSVVETARSTDLTSVKVGDFVVIETTDAKRMKKYSRWGIKLGKPHEVFTVDTDDTERSLQVLNYKGVPIWV